MIMYPESVKKAFLIGIAALFLVVPVSATPIDPVDLQVVDADTIQTYRQRPNVRLVGFNAPETRNAACQAEADLGAKATQRLRELVKLGNLDFAYVRCSCPDTTRSCN